jgi:hypothetical protein
MEKFEEPNEETILAIQEARAEINLMKVEDISFIENFLKQDLEEVDEEDLIELASNENLEKKHLTKICKKCFSSGYVIEAVLRNKNCPNSIFKNLMKVEDDEFILSVIAEKTKDKTILEELVFKEQDGEVLAYVFENENCSIELKEKIIKIKNFKDFLKLNDLKVKDYKLLKKI